MKLISGALALLMAVTVSSTEAWADIIPTTTYSSDFLMVGMGNSASTDDAININSSNQLGANTEFLSTSDPNTRDVFYQNGDRWVSPTAVPAGAKTMFVGTDYSGNLAITSSSGKVSLSDIDVYATLGVQCSNSSDANCTQSISNSYWQENSGASVLSMAGGDGIFPSYNSTNLLNELSMWDAYFASLTSEYTLSSDIVDQNDKDGSLLDVFYTDLNNDGFVIVDIDVDGDFDVNNSDWIIDAYDGTVIFRILNGSNFVLSNSSILAGDSGIDGILFWHSSEPTDSSDQVFNFNNVILNDVALWDLNRIGDTTGSYNNTQININNGQGCAQFISQEITMNDVRWARCDFSRTTVPEPTTLVLLGLGLAGLGLTRRRFHR